MLVGGILTETDIQSEYLSAASDTFKTFIVDPESTINKTDRYLKHRYIMISACVIVCVCARACLCVCVCVRAFIYEWVSAFMRVCLANSTSREATITMLDTNLVVFGDIYKNNMKKIGDVHP